MNSVGQGLIAVVFVFMVDVCMRKIYNCQILNFSGATATVTSASSASSTQGTSMPLQSFQIYY